MPQNIRVVAKFGGVLVGTIAGTVICSFPAAAQLPHLSPPPSPPSQDPAEQVAPAAVPVEPGALPITRIEQLAMQQELVNLIGRFESALLSADSAIASTELSPPRTASAPGNAARDLIITASNAAKLTQLAPPSGTANTIVAQARQILQNFPQWVSRRDYVTARQRWLEARQILWDNFPTDRPLAQPEIRAMWLDRGTIVQARSRQGLAEIFDRLAAAGINTIFFETVNAGYPIYPSDIAPQQNPLIFGWDPLAEAVDLAHERGMELHAWVWTFAAGNARHNSIVNLPVDYPGPLIAANPDWANYDNRGNRIPPGQTKPFLDPANPAVRRYLLQLFEEIVTRYEVDGLQLDYIRYPFQDPGAGRTYGYGSAARQQFQALTGVDPLTISPTQRQLWERWTDFRTHQINSFVAQTSRLLRRHNPDLVLSTAVFPLPTHERLHKIQQNWETWAQQGHVDLIVTMSYAMDTNRLQRLVIPWLNNVELGPVLVLPSIRLLNLTGSATFDQLQAIRDMPSGGFSLFAVADLNSTLQEIFHRTQGHRPDPNQSPDPIPYRQPFHSAIARYTALQREWSFMMANGQLWIQDPEMTEWSAKAEELGRSLKDLAERPSHQRYQRAKTQLNDFRTEFDEWMSLQALIDGYRVETWDNRLETLETLLNYGEHFVLQR